MSLKPFTPSPSAPPGHTELEEDELVVSVPADSLDPVEDIDDAENAVAENSPIGTTVGITVRSAAAATYTLTDSAGGLFAIHPQSGVVTVAADMLNYEAFSSHTIIAQARNNTGRQILPLIIRVTDEPEPVGHLTDIDLSPNKISYGAKRGDAVGIIARAIDPDRGSEVTYSLSKNAGGLFAIGEHDGVVTLASAAYGLEQDYLIEITAMSSDGGAPSIARFTIMPNEPIRIEPAPAASILREGESQDITFSFAKADLEVKRISAGESHSCAITSDNRAVCWGNNQGNKATPPSGKKFIAVSAGSLHSCGITSDNDAVCWGRSYLANPPPG